MMSVTVLVCSALPYRELIVSPNPNPNPNAVCACKLLSEGDVLVVVVDE
jgi:hypothetical protein